MLSPDYTPDYSRKHEVGDTLVTSLPRETLKTPSAARSHLDQEKRVSLTSWVAQGKTGKQPKDRKGAGSHSDSLTLVQSKL